MGIFQGKVAIVTGAGIGIGRAEALSLAAWGAAVVVNNLGGETHDGRGRGQHGPADAVVSEIVQGGGRTVANHGDVCDWKTTSGMIEQALTMADLARVADKLEIIEVCTRTHWRCDHETWDGLDALFADTVAMPALAQVNEPGFDEAWPRRGSA